jgi:hypothetical protein
MTRRPRAGVGPHRLDRTQPSSNANLGHRGPESAAAGRPDVAPAPCTNSRARPAITIGGPSHRLRAASMIGHTGHHHGHHHDREPPLVSPLERIEWRAGRDVDDRPDAPVVAASTLQIATPWGSPMPRQTVGLGRLTDAAERTRHQRILLVSRRRCLPYARGWIRSAPDRRVSGTPAGPGRHTGCLRAWGG